MSFRRLPSILPQTPAARSTALCQCKRVELRLAITECAGRCLLLLPQRNSPYVVYCVTENCGTGYRTMQLLHYLLLPGAWLLLSLGLQRLPILICVHLTDRVVVDADISYGELLTRVVGARGQLGRRGAGWSKTGTGCDGDGVQSRG